jgi:HlyD family secretion protein
MTPVNQQDKNLLDMIAKASPTKTASIVKRAIWVVVAIVMIALAIFAIFDKTSDSNIQYVTQEVAVGKLIVTVSATGQLQPTNEVEVGSEISGLVERVYVDENDVVKHGQLLAKLDTAKLTDQVSKSKASVRAAEAQVEQTQATVAETAASLSRLRKVAELSGGKVPSKTELESAEASMLRAKANELSAKAGVAQALATLKSDETNLSKASIKSPIDGIVLTRTVEPGQTVAASLQTPVLFTLAENLTQMELQVDVDEADVGQVKAGQSTYFTVDAWPDRRYPAEIVRVGFGSQVKDNVVTYKTVLKVSNDDLTLRPGMTATAEITTASTEGVLKVPNAALRFTPNVSSQNKKNDGIVASLIPRPPQQNNQKKTTLKNGASKVWILRNNVPEELNVKTGLTDGSFTEILEGDLRAGMQVITETQTKK